MTTTIAYKYRHEYRFPFGHMFLCFPSCGLFFHFYCFFLCLFVSFPSKRMHFTGIYRIKSRFFRGGFRDAALPPQWRALRPGRRTRPGVMTVISRHLEWHVAHLSKGCRVLSRRTSKYCGDKDVHESASLCREPTERVWRSSVSFVDFTGNFL